MVRLKSTERLGTMKVNRGGMWSPKPTFAKRRRMRATCEEIVELDSANAGS
jgi:hypothetical protein